MPDYLQQSADYHDPAVASALDELSFWSSRFGAILFEHLPIRGEVSVLDVGCAAGFPLFELAHVFGNTEDRLNALARQAGELVMTVPVLYVEGERR